MRVGRVVVALAVACIAGSVVLPAKRLTPTAAALGGCFADDCTPDGQIIESNQGRFLDADTWESAPIDGVWHDFQGADYISFRPDFGGRTPYAVEYFVSVSARPLADGNWITQATGNLVLQNNFRPNEFAVTNGTCSHYFIRAIAHAGPVLPPPVDADAGDGGDAGPPDGGDAGETDAGETDAGD